MIVLTLVRHAPTVWNADGRMQGRSDVPLSPEGQSLARSWRLPDGLEQAMWMTSPLQRARQTAEILGVSALVDDRLIEMDWGDWEGETLSSLRETQGTSMVVNEARGLNFAPPNGESPRMVQQRVQPWLQDVGSSTYPIAAITHKGVIRAVTALATGWDMTGKEPQKLKPNTCRQFAVSRDGSIELVRPSITLTDA